MEHQYPQPPKAATPPPNRTVTFTEERLAALFNVWMLRFTEDPAKYEREYQSVSRFLTERNEGKEPSYGAWCVEYLKRLERDGA